MNYLEVKLTNDKEVIDSKNFLSDIIKSQKTLRLKSDTKLFNHSALEALGFIFNTTTQGFALEKKFTVDELFFLTIEVNKLEHHILTHAYLELKIHNDTLYIWDKALIYEGIDSFEYCLKYHNIHTLELLNVVTKSDSINENLLNLVSYTKRYSQPSLEYITQNCYWDKQKGIKIARELISDLYVYIQIVESKNVINRN